MNISYSYRDRLAASDLERIPSILERHGLFTQEEVEVAMELARDHVIRQTASDYRFFAVDVQPADTEPVTPIFAGFSCYGRIPLTVASFDLYWIALAPEWTHRGLGRALLVRTEDAIRRDGGRRLYADTSARAEYGPTRAFYEARGFRAAAFFEDFYAPGDGKIVYVKLL